MKIKKVQKSPEKIKYKTRPGESLDGASFLPEWWKADNDMQLAMQVTQTASWLKKDQEYRIRQLAVSVRLYCGLSVYSYAGSNVSKMDRSKSLPDDRPTFNVVSACTDTLVSKICQDNPQPRFLTENADYKKRHLAQELNQFVLGEFDQTKAYEKGTKVLRDCCVMGTGVMKVYRGDNDKVCLDRVMMTDLYVDDNDSLNGQPQSMIQLKLVDRDKLITQNPTKAHILAASPNGYPDNVPDSGRTIADQIMVVEAWKLPSGPDPEEEGYIAGRHTICVVNGILVDEPWEKEKFPFVFIKYSDPFLGFWGQGLGTRLFGNQLTLNRLMYTIARSITLVGVPRVFVEQSSKVVKAHLNNEIGTIVTYSGTKPTYEVAPCVPAELYAERDRIIDYAFRQEGISMMQASAQKPAGLDSGEAIRTYDDISSDRFATLAKKYENFYIELAYMITDLAMDIAKDIGKYQTVYPNKDGTKQISLPQMDFLKDPFVIQCFSQSSLPRTPAGRLQKVAEMIQSGMVTIKEGRRLMHFPDLEQDEKLANASEERIFQILDDIVHEGKYTMPDPFLDLQLATQLTVQYINLYLQTNLEEEKADLLRKFFKQVQALIQGSQPIAPPVPAPVPTANPQPAPTSPLVPNVPPAA